MHMYMGDIIPIPSDIDSPLNIAPYDGLHHSFDIVPLVYSDTIDTSVITNVMLIDNSVQEYQQFVDGCNDHTFPIVYDYHSDRNELKELLMRKFSSIQRIVFVFHNAGMNGKLFLNNQCFFNDSENPETFSENLQVLVDIIRDFHVSHVDYLACNSLQYDNWKNYYEILKTSTNVVVSASNDATGNLQYGGDWVMESTNEDIKTTYFNDSIDEYTKTLATSVISSSITLLNVSLNDSNLYTWPITIDGGTVSAPVVITLGDDITLNNVSKYFIIGSDYVIIDGSNTTVTISGLSGYPGLIQNGTWSAIGKSNITVKNINITSNGSTLNQYGGWICQHHFCRSSTGVNKITNCTNSGNITTAETGGIVGYRFALQSSGNNTISNCINTGSVSGNSAGGIAGYYFGQLSAGTNIIKDCSNNGIVSGLAAGGIAGTYFAFQSQAGSANTILNCTNNGVVSGNNAGGIAGDNFGYGAVSGSVNTIKDCINSGSVLGGSAGGIAGISFGNKSLQGSINEIKDCKNIGSVSGDSAGGIAGYYFAIQSSANNKITNCTNSGNILASNAGGIVGTYYGHTSAGTNTISNCTNSGNILGVSAGGIAGIYFAYRSQTNSANTILNCTNSGDVSGNKAGGIVGDSFGRESSSGSTNTIMQCTNSGSVYGGAAGGIAGSSFGNNSTAGSTNEIKDCSNNAPISGSAAGGIAGNNFAISSKGNSINKITNCINSGNVSAGDAGGIAGSFFGHTSAGTNTISNCTNSGNISANNAGGIAGSQYAYNSSGTNTISNCTNSGVFSAASAGGIAGHAFGNGSLLSSINTITNCINTGNGSGYGSGGIASTQFGNSSTGTNTIKNCANTGVISGGGGIVGVNFSFQSTSANSVTNCYTLFGVIGTTTQYSSNTYEANGSWSTTTAKTKLLLTVNATYIWAYTKLNGVNKQTSPFLLYSLNPTNSPVGLSIPTIITHSTIPTKTFGDAFFSLNPSSNSDASFSYVSSNTSIATTSGNIVTIIGAGTAQIRISQPEYYDCSAGFIDVSFVVNKASTTLSSLIFTSPQTFSDSSFTLTDPSSNGIGSFTYTSSNTNVATISGKTVTIVGAGETKITANYTSNNYQDASVDASFVVNRAPTQLGALIFTSPQTFGNSSFTLTDPSSNGIGSFTYTSSNTNVATIAGKTVTIVGVGNTTITVKQDACGNYTDGSNSMPLVVNPATPLLSNFTIPSTINEHTQIQLNPPQSTNPSGAFTYASSNPNVATIMNNNILQILSKGTTTITATQVVNTNYYSNSISTLFDTATIQFPSPTNILPNQITGTSEPNSTIVITETTLNNQIITNQTQSNSQGIWNFNVTTPSNRFSFAPLNANQFANTIQSNYNMKYPKSKYILTTNNKVFIKPRQYGTNELDQRSWRITPKLPKGLKFASSTGIISGTPTEACPSTTYKIFSNSEVFLGYCAGVTIEIVAP
jgi:hypothetical protein